MLRTVLEAKEWEDKSVTLYGLGKPIVIYIISFPCHWLWSGWQSCSANDGIQPASLDSFVLCEQFRVHFQKPKWDSPLLWSYGLPFSTAGRAEGCLHQHHHGHVSNTSHCGCSARGWKEFFSCITILWDHCCICGSSWPTMSLCGADYSSLSLTGRFL